MGTLGLPSVDTWRGVLKTCKGNVCCLWELCIFPEELSDAKMWIGSQRPSGVS